MQMEELRSYKPQILELAAQYGVSNIRVFGSVARGDADEDSDVDLLIDMARGKGLFNFIAFQHAVTDLLGRKVDIGQVEGVRNPIRLNRLLKEQVPL